MQSSLRLGVAGLGTVGASVVKLLARHADDLAIRCGRPIVLRAVCARDRTKDRGFSLAHVNWFQDPVKLAMSPDIDVFVELIGGASGAAEASVRAALDAGKHVVTANKALLARHGVELAALAEKRGISLNFEAAVAGGIPIIKTLREALAGNQVSRVYGILNGTCNYILTRMEREKLSFETCLKDAQALGYAETDPTFDIGGFDTAHKLALLTALAFGSQIDIDSIEIDGISRITLADIEAADELGYRIKLLGIAEMGPNGIEQRVHPTMVPKSSAIARIDGVLNAVAVDADYVGELILVGPGAGGNATASSVVSDIADVARGTALTNMMGRPAGNMQPYRRNATERLQSGYYVRLSVYDRPGALAAIVARLAERDISIESIVQRSRAPRADAPGMHARDVPQPVILISYETSERAMSEALDQIRADGHVSEPPQFLRIEQL
ncbi:MAG: homoserine dehydrogenase [Ancalomicrobiaceae bacterium]|nr:homoserine dehydrogenase [Ancalomicrobiaceae bacterium]